MSRRIIAVAALALAVLMALTGCNLVRVDEAVDAATVVASFNGGTVTKGEVEPTYTYYVDYYDLLSSAYGITISTDGLLEQVTETVVQQKVLLNKAQELGLALTDEEEQEVAEETAETFEETVQEYWDSFAEDGLTDEEIRADVEAYLAENGVTMESALADAKDAKLLEKLQEHVYAGVSVLPEEVQDRYNEKVAQDELLYSDAATFESDVSTAGTTIAWYPEGYRTVKQILVAFPEETQEAISTIDTTIASLEQQIEELTATFETEDAEAEETTDAEADGEEEGTLSVADQLAALNEELTAAQTERDELVASASAELQGTIDEIYARIEAGEDFLALMDEYNEDTGMTIEPMATTGYYVSEGSASWVASFRDAAMALEAAGDISEPVTSSYGLHIIRYESDVTAGPVPMDEMYDTIEAEVLSEKQQEAYEADVTAWIAEADVKYDYSSFN